jgi:ubiquinone/menaquinone biosynthesis C-methylase UbiE
MNLIAHDKNTEERKLNIGCGNAPKEGYLNVDIGDCDKDMFMDVTEPLPFPDETFTHIFAQHVLEHIPRENFFRVFREIHRILRKGGTLDFCVPKAGSDNFWTDPTHTMPFTDRTMDFLIEGKQLRENGIIYGADYAFTELSKPQIDGVETLYFLLGKE